MTAQAPWETPASGPAAALVARLAEALPRVETPRLVLRAPRIGDFEAYAAIVCGPEGVHVGGPMEREEAWRDFAQMVAGWLLRGAGLWSVERREDGRLVGFVPLNHEFGDPEMELGWFMLPEAQGRGFAAEAAMAARRVARDELGLRGLVSYIAEGNDRSIRLAERLGAARDAARHPGDAEVIVFRHPQMEPTP